MQYIKKIVDSFKILFNNPKLFIPDLIGIIISFAIGIFFINYNKLSSIDIYNPEIAAQIAKNIVNHPPTFKKFLISIFVAILIAVALNLSIAAMRYIMIRKSIRKENISIINSYKESYNYIWKIMLIRIFTIMLYLIPATIFVTVLILLNISQTLLAVLTIIIFLILILVVSSIFLFIYPEMIFKNKSAILTIKETYVKFKSNYKKSIATFIISILITYSFIILTNLLLTYFGIRVLQFKPIFSILFVYIWIVKPLIQIPIRVWSDIFIFKNY